MNAEKRRQMVIDELGRAEAPLSGGALAKAVGVSRQVIVQDIALLRAQGNNIVSTNRGYVIPTQRGNKHVRLFKVRHRADQAVDEMETIVDLGGVIVDVAVNHRMYGRVSAPMGIRSRRDIALFVDDLESGCSTLLSTVTDGYHFHHVEADSEEILDEIHSALEVKGYIAEFLPYEQER